MFRSIGGCPCRALGAIDESDLDVVANGTKLEICHDAELGQGVGLNGLMLTHTLHKTIISVQMQAVSACLLKTVDLGLRTHMPWQEGYQ